MDRVVIFRANVNINYLMRVLRRSSKSIKRSSKCIRRISKCIRRISTKRISIRKSSIRKSSIRRISRSREVILLVDYSSMNTSSRID